MAKRNPFKNKARPPAPAPDSVQELANRLQAEGRVQELEGALERLDKTKLTTAEQESWWHLYGAAAFHAGRDAEATARFEEGHRLFPSSALIAFSLGQQFIRAREVDRGFEVFRSSGFPSLPSEFVMAQVRYAYLWSRYEDGRAMLRPMLEAYRELKILDDHFVYVRGLPFFGRWWSSFAAMSLLASDTRELEQITESVANSCADYDFEYLRLELIAARDDRPEVLLPHLEQRSDTATGYNGLHAAVIRARAATDQAAAERMFDDVALSQTDFPWLGDIRTLAKAEIAHRFGRPELETQRIDEFVSRQGMLFEPDIALNFHLLRYQERLKPGYQHR